VGYTFDHCNLMLARCKGIDLRGRVLEGLRLDEADLAAADLRETVWVESRLRGASLIGARLAGADLRGADLGELTVEQAQYLRGAMIGPAQARLLLGALGITLAD
jgi:uncharacterized protein YjbI with pentapeptide repeats